MQIDLARVSYDGQWRTHGEAELKIRPYPTSRDDTIITKDGSVIISAQHGVEMFIYCLAEWRNVSAADGKPLPLTDEIKKQIFDFQLGKVKNEKGEETSMSAFVLTEARKMMAEFGAELKN